MASSDDTREDQAPANSSPHLWQPGKSGNPAGRPKGARSTLAEKFLRALHDDFATHGATVIEKVRVQRPSAYLKIIAATLPKQVHVTTNAVTEMSDDELSAALAALERLTSVQRADSRGGEKTQH